MCGMVALILGDIEPMDIQQLEIASRTYYAGNPTMTDAEFDAGVAQLKKDNPDHPFLKLVGAPVPGTLKAKHNMPMGSLSNANNEKEFKAWVPDGNPIICLSHKLDGSSLELVYKEGKFVQAITRGDGEVGEDVTRNVLLSRNIPLEIHPSITSVRCECLIYKKDWDEHFEGDANPRNSAAGTLRRHDGNNARYLQFFAFDLSVDKKLANEEILSCANSEYTTLYWLSDWFNVPDYVEHSKVHSLIEWCKKAEASRDTLQYEIDGVVAKIDDRNKSQAMGIKNGRPKGQIAIKFKPRGGETILRRVVWQVGQTGALTPVGEVDPVVVGGTKIRRVTLCNIDEIERLGIAIGDTVEVVRAGDVVPKLLRCVRKNESRQTIAYPCRCPICGWQTTRTGPKIFCTNGLCEGQSLERVMTWIKKRNILNLGIGVVEAASIKSIKHLYDMELNDWANVQVKNGKFGVKRATKIMEALEKSKSVSLSDFLGSIGIKGVGRSLASVLCKSFSGLPDSQLTLTDVSKLYWQQIEKQEGFGRIRAVDFCDWLQDHKQEITDLADVLDIQYETHDTKGVFSGEIVCFTGKSPKPRSEMSRLAEAAGASVSSSIKSDTTILVIADINSTSSKAVKARELGIKLISPEYFLNKTVQHPH